MRRSRSCIFSEDGSLDGGTICNGLIMVDALVGLFAIEKVGHYMGDTSGTSNKDDLVDVSLVNLRITESFLNRLEGTMEKILAKLLETGMSERWIEVDTLKKGANLNGGLGGG